MKMEYKLIELVKKGFILTREPEVVTDELIITFTGAPDGATAIFENADRAAWYASLTEEQKAEVQSWRKAWLDAPETGIIPEKPRWIK